MKRKLGARGCPSCGAATLKAGGCPRVKCGHCGLSWDWDMGNTTFQPQKRSRQEYMRSALLFLIGCSTCWIATFPQAPWVMRLAMIDATLFCAAEVRSRGHKFVSSHFVLVALSVVVAVVIPLVANACASALMAVVPVGGLLHTTASLLSHGTCGCGTLIGGFFAGLAGVLASAEWIPPLYRVLLRL